MKSYKLSDAVQSRSRTINTFLKVILAISILFHLYCLTKLSNMQEQQKNLHVSHAVSLDQISELQFRNDELEEQVDNMGNKISDFKDTIKVSKNEQKEYQRQMETALGKHAEENLKLKKKSVMLSEQLTIAQMTGKELKNRIEGMQKEMIVCEDNFKQALEKLNLSKDKEVTCSRNLINAQMIMSTLNDKNDLFRSEILRLTSQLDLLEQHQKALENQRLKHKIILPHLNGYKENSLGFENPKEQEVLLDQIQAKNLASHGTQIMKDKKDKRINFGVLDSKHSNNLISTNALPNLHAFSIIPQTSDISSANGSLSPQSSAQSLDIGPQGNQSADKSPDDMPQGPQSAGEYSHNGPHGSQSLNTSPDNGPESPQLLDMLPDDMPQGPQSSLESLSNGPHGSQSLDKSPDNGPESPQLLDMLPHDMPQGSQSSLESLSNGPHDSQSLDKSLDNGPERPQLDISPDGMS